MRDSMHILDQLRQRGYEPQDEARDGEGWYDRHYPNANATLRVVLTNDEVTLYAFTGRMVLEWEARFPDGCPAAVILAALSAAEHDAHGQDAHLIGHWHSYAGQMLEHSHADGDKPHGYYEHPEDAGGTQDGAECCEECGQPVPGEIISYRHAKSCSGYPKSV